MDNNYSEFVYTQHIIAESRLMALTRENDLLKQRIEALEEVVSTLEAMVQTGAKDPAL